MSQRITPHNTYLKIHTDSKFSPLTQKTFSVNIKKTFSIGDYEWFGILYASYLRRNR